VGVPEKNYVTDLGVFITRWNTHEEQQYPALDRVVVGVAGNINYTGEPACSSSLMLTRWHPNFSDVVEPGVRDLVAVLIERLDCITYSSCEGHPATETSEMRCRHVGIVARSRHELERFKGVLVRAAEIGEERSVEVVAEVVQIESDGDDGIGIDVVFRPSSIDDFGYFDELGAVTRDFATRLCEICCESVAPVPGEARSSRRDTEGGRLA
jgi:hypothetical protein